MKGMKRFAPSESNPETNYSDFRSKRIIEASPFDVHRAESSRQYLKTNPTLDLQRAALSQQHVRALNTQFASWVQSQLQNHPDELWEDGVRDYLTHSSTIVEKFSDVVDWLKANAAKAESISPTDPCTTEKQSVPEVMKNEIKVPHEKSGFAPPVGSTASFATSWSSTLFSGNQTPVLFGSQGSLPVNHQAANDLDGENDPEQPSSPSVKKTEEKGILVVHEVKCKLYVKSTDTADKDTWKDKGMGLLSIKCIEGASKSSKESKPTIVVRNDVGKVILNAFLYPGIKTNLQKNSIVAIFHTSGENGGNDGSNNDTVVARTYLIRTKTEEERNKLVQAIQEYAPSA